MRIRQLAGSALVALLSLPALAQVSPLELIGERPKPFIEPEGFYRVILPPGFDCELPKDRKRTVECTGRWAPKPKLWVTVGDVPRSATAKLYWLNEKDRFKKKPHFKVIKVEETKIRGIPAVEATFSYDYQGNVQYPVGVRAVYFIQEDKLYVVHFESRLEQFPKYMRDLTIFFESFHPTKLDPGGNPILEDVQVETDERPDHIKNPSKHGW